MSTATDDSTTPATPQNIPDYVALFATDNAATTQHPALDTQQSALQALAEALNDLSNDGLTVWREGDQWRWHWRGTTLWAGMERLGLGDAVLDAIDARGVAPVIAP